MKNQKGFSAIEGLLIIVILGLIGFTGWYVWNSGKKTGDILEKSGQSASISKGRYVNDQNENTKSEVESDWLLYTSAKNAFTIRLANGLTFYEDKSEPFIYTRKLEASNQDKAKVEEIFGGSDNPVGFFMNANENTDSQVMRGTKSTLVSHNGDIIEKYYFVQSNEPDGIDIPKDGVEYSYRFSKNGSARLIIRYATYSNTEASKNLELVERMVKTVQLP